MAELKEKPFCYCPVCALNPTTKCLRSKEGTSLCPSDIKDCQDDHVVELQLLGAGFNAYTGANSKTCVCPAGFIFKDVVRGQTHKQALSQANNLKKAALVRTFLGKRKVTLDAADLKLLIPVLGAWTKLKKDIESEISKSEDSQKATANGVVASVNTVIADLKKWVKDCSPPAKKSSAKAVPAAKKASAKAVPAKKASAKAVPAKAASKKA